jgi:hypothetical protein
MDAREAARRSSILPGKIPWTSPPYSRSTPKVTSGLPFTSGSTAVSSCSWAAWSPSTTLCARPGAGLAPFGFAAAVTTAASFTVLQAVDGITLRYAVDAWASAPAPQKTAAFAAAEVAR